jgi:hypothetical protein
MQQVHKLLAVGVLTTHVVHTVHAMGGSYRNCTWINGCIQLYVLHIHPDRQEGFCGIFRRYCTTGLD